VAGAALLLRARRIAGEIGGLRAQARSLASGIEAEVVLTLDSHYPMEGLFIVLRRFRDFWPMVQLKILVDNMGAAAEQVLEGRSSLGVLSPLVARHPAMIFKGISPQVQLTIVAAPCHPLAAWEGVIPVEELSRHVQLVLTDRSTLLAGQDFGVLSPQTWRIGDLGAKLAMLRAGFGWGSMPLHMIGDDLNARRLVRIHPVGWGEGRTMTMFLAQRIDAVLGPAGTWLADRLTEPSS
jgi:DNA-binding transcriptional LysR family regulator